MTSSVTRRVLRRCAALLVAAGVLLAPAPSLAAGPTPSAGPSSAGAESPTSVAHALAVDPVYLSTSSGTPAVDRAAVRAALPPQTVVAVLPPAALTGVEGGVDVLAPELSGRLGRGGTVILLAGRQLGAASSTVAGSLGDDLATARGVLEGRPTDPAAPGLALLTLERSVGAASNASGGLAPDPSTAPRAGSPGGASGLYALLAVVLTGLVLGAVRLVGRRRQARAPRRLAPEPPRRTRVEVDAYGRIVRRVRPDEQD